MARGERPVLVFRIGSLGDTVISLPALWAVRGHFAGARITLLSDHHPGRGFVRADDLLAGSGVVDDFLPYAYRTSRAGRLASMGRLLVTLRSRGYGDLVYLAPTGRTRAQVDRDRAFFRAAGVRRLLGMGAPFDFPARVSGRPPAALPSEADLIAARLAPDGVAVPPPGRGRMDLGLGDADERLVRAWRAGLPPDGGRPWVAVGPGSKMPAKRWPESRYHEVVARLIRDLNAWPVVFGGPEDCEAGARLLAGWGAGYNAAGTLGLRTSAAAMRRCRFYVGNDTGTMHMAVAAGLKCVAVFSSRSHVGLWYPYGDGHRVFRTAIDCEGCELTECRIREMECLTRIRVDDVHGGCVDLWGRSAGRAWPSPG